MVRPKFKHFIKEEIDVMERFIEKGILKGHYNYDVPLRTVDPEVFLLSEPSERKSWEYRTSKKIDAVLEAWDEIWILEIKHKVRPSAIGQVLVYNDMFQEQYRPVKPVRLGVVAAIDDPATTKVAKRHNISVWIV